MSRILCRKYNISPYYKFKQKYDPQYIFDLQHYNKNLDALTLINLSNPLIDLTRFIDVRVNNKYFIKCTIVLNQ